MIKRDIPFWRDIKFPENPESWYDFYCALRERDAKELEIQAEQIRRSMAGLTSQKAKQCPKVINAKGLGLPQEKPTTMQKYANYDRRMGGLQPIFAKPPPPKPGDRGIHPDKKVPSMYLETPKIRGKTRSKKSALPVVRRNSRLCVPTHKLNARASTIRKAPTSLVEEYRIERRVAQHYGARRMEAGTATPQNRVRTLENTGTQRPNLPSQGRPRVKPVTLSSTRPNTTSPATRQAQPLVENSSFPTTPRRQLSPTSPVPVAGFPIRPAQAHSPSLSPVKRRSPANPLFIPKKRPGPPPESTKVACQPFSNKRPADSRLDTTSPANNPKKARVS